MKGFTLLEILFVTAISCLLLTFSIASYSVILKYNEQEVIINDLKNVIQFAKSYALLNNHTISLKPIDDANNWSKGLVITDDSTEIPKAIQYRSWHHPQWNLKWKGARPANKIVFPGTLSAAVDNGTFILSYKDNALIKKIIINRIGRIKII